MSLRSATSVLLVGWAFAGGAAGAVPATDGERVRPALRAKMGERRVAFVAVLREQPDLRRLTRQLQRDGVSSRAELGRRVSEALREHAARTQAALLPVLEELEREGELEHFWSVSVLNAIVLEGRAAAVERLAARPEIARLDDDRLDAAPAEPVTRSRPGELTPVGSVPPAFMHAPRGVGAPELWARGLDGEGVVIAVLDTGVNGRHPQLLPTWRGGEDAWFDPIRGGSSPRDTGSHGSSVCSAAVAANVGGLELGVAPGARWVAGVATPRQSFSWGAFLRTLDWALHRARPDVVLLTFGLRSGRCMPEMAQPLGALRAAGHVVIVAAGNDGGAPSTDESPANLVLHDGRPVLSVGGLAGGSHLYPDSALGPSSCSGALYPQVCAPAMRVAVALGRGTGLAVTDGTSQAAGLVAGGAALLLQAHPEASAEQVEDALRNGTVDLGPPGPDNLFGHGAVSLPDALEALERTLDEAGRPPPPPHPSFGR